MAIEKRIAGYSKNIRKIAKSIRRLSIVVRNLSREIRKLSRKVRKMSCRLKGAARKISIFKCINRNVDRIHYVGYSIVNVLKKRLKHT